VLGDADPTDSDEFRRSSPSPERCLPVTSHRPGTRCTVCAHAAFNAIDRELVAGTPASELARQYNLHERAIQRHRTSHLPALLIQAAGVVTVARALDLRGQVEGVLAELNRRAAGAGEDTDTYLRIADRLVRALELLGRLTGELQAGAVSVNVACVSAFGMPETEVRGIIETHRQAAATSIQECADDAIALARWVLSQEPERRAAMLEALGAS